VSDRWSIYIDIDGFSAGWEKDNTVLWSLGKLMEGIFRVGNKCCPRTSDRLFAHQFGDGFIVVSDFHEESLERCVTIAVALMRHVAANGSFARAAIAEGDLSDIKGCYPREVVGYEGDLTVPLGEGIMTISPVMGTALTRAVYVDKKAKPGPLLLADPSKKERLGSAVPYRKIPRRDCQEKHLLSIDWVHMNSELLCEVQARAQLQCLAAADLQRRLKEHCEHGGVPDDWRKSVYEFLLA
jgi:hypothetical protein